MTCSSENCACGVPEKATRTDSQDETEDIWASDNDESNFIPQTNEHYGDMNNVPTHVESLALQRKHAKQGYLDGLSSAKEESLQQGFDDGYPVGAALGVKIGEILIKIQYLLKQNKCQQQLYDTALEECNIQKVLHLNYFNQDLKLISEDHPVVLKWENIINEIMNEN